MIDKPLRDQTSVGYGVAGQRTPADVPTESTEMRKVLEDLAESLDRLACQSSRIGASLMRLGAPFSDDAKLAGGPCRPEPENALDRLRMLGDALRYQSFQARDMADRLDRTV